MTIIGERWFLKSRLIIDSKTFGKKEYFLIEVSFIYRKKKKKR